MAEARLGGARPAGDLAHERAYSLRLADQDPSTLKF